jgi:hypothetical protein
MKPKIKRKRKSRAKPKLETKTMAKKNKAEHEVEGDYAEPATDAAEQQTLPPPDPPVVPSPPFPPPAFDAVDESEKGAQPEATAVRELELLQVGTRGEGPAPEAAPEEPTP